MEREGARAEAALAAAVPEPGVSGVLLTSLGGMLGRRRRVIRTLEAG